jgi:acetyl esterase/lipase
MKVTDEMIHPELLKNGKLFRALIPKFTVPKLKFLAKIFDLIYSDTRQPKNMQMEIVELPRGDGTKVKLYVYRPLQPKENVPGVLWLHSGGFVMGTARSAPQEWPSGLMEVSNCVIVSPEYRLSFEAPYPAAFEDCYAGLIWMKDHASQLGIDDSRLVVCGDSSGGCLTAALCIYARDKGEVAVSFQLPLYPMLDDRQNTDSLRDNDGPVWNEENNRFAWQLYLGEGYGLPETPVYAAPGRLTDFKGLPPAASFVGSIDPLRDEVVAYFDGLKKEGIPAELKIYEGCFHGFDGFCEKANVSKEARKFIIGHFQYAIENYRAPQKA